MTHKRSEEVRGRCALGLWELQARPLSSGLLSVQGLLGIHRFLLQTKKVQI